MNQFRKHLLRGGGDDICNLGHDTHVHRDDGTRVHHGRDDDVHHAHGDVHDDILHSVLCGVFSCSFRLVVL